jgi:hypothetical protein
MGQCVLGECVLGECLYVADDTRCTTGTCTSTLSCRSAGLDASLTADGGAVRDDAAARDATVVDSGRCPAPEMCDNGLDDDCDGVLDCADADCGGCDDGMPCTRDSCDAASGRCGHRPEPAGLGCTDDGRPCTADACDADGTCTHAPLADGSACLAGQCCGGECRMSATDAASCGACGISCPAGRSCTAGACGCGSNAECVAAGYGSLATCFGGQCQCRCTESATDRVECSGQCVGRATCRQTDGLNPCVYP